MAIIAKFGNGLMESNANLKFGVFEKVTGSNVESVLVAENDTTSYKGRLNQPQDYRLMLGIRHRATKKIRLYPTSLYEVSLPELETEEKDDLEENRSYLAWKDKLTEAFGTRGKRKALASKKLNHVAPDALEEVVGTVANEAMETVVELPVAPETQSDILPPYYKDATKPEDIFPMRHIIDDNELAVLSAKCTVFYSPSKDDIKSWKDDSVYPTFVLDRLNRLPLAEEPRQRMASLLLYFSYLCELHGTKAFQLRKQSFLSHVPDLLRKKLIKSFTVEANGQRALPRRLKDKLLAHILIICLTIDQFNLNFAPLSADLKIGAQKLKTFLTNMGCKISRAKKFTLGSDEPRAILSVPFVLPKAKTFTMKRKA